MLVLARCPALWCQMVNAAVGAHIKPGGIGCGRRRHTTLGKKTLLESETGACGHIL